MTAVYADVAIPFADLSAAARDRGMTVEQFTAWAVNCAVVDWRNEKAVRAELDAAPGKNNRPQAVRSDQ